MKTLPATPGCVYYDALKPLSLVSRVIELHYQDVQSSCRDK